MHILLLALGALLALESGLRLLTGQSSRWNLRLGAHKVYDPVVFMRNQPNYTFADGTTTNEYGYWAPSDLRQEKPPGSLRIIYLGDSNTVFPLGRNYPVQVEKILEARSGLEVQTVNAAVPGYSSENARLLMETELSRFEADYFFIYLGWNDLGQFGPDGLSYKRARAGYRLSRLQQAISNLYSLRFVYALRNVLRHRRPTVNEPMDVESRQLYATYWPDHFVKNLTRILEIARERYPHVYVMTLATLTNARPTPQELRRAHFPVGMDKNMAKLHDLVGTYNRAVREVAASTAVPIIDLYALFNTPEARDSFTDSCHLDEKGAGRIAERVVSRILASEARVFPSSTSARDATAPQREETGLDGRSPPGRATGLTRG